MLSNIAGKRKFRSRAGPTAMLTCRVSDDSDLEDARCSVVSFPTRQAQVREISYGWLATARLAR
jgi:hypothetical protein